MSPKFPGENESSIVPQIETEQLTERDLVEKKLKEIFGDKLIPVEQAGEIIEEFKDGSFAMSEMGMMLYANGHNLRGFSHRYPNGLIYHDGENIFGVGYFAKEGETEGHLMIVSPKGVRAKEAVEDFISKVRSVGMAKLSIYVRHLNDDECDQFLRDTNMVGIDLDPWHPEAKEEDEYYPNRVFDLDELLDTDERGNITEIKTLKGATDKGHRRKNQMAYQRFENFLQRNKLRIEIKPYRYTEEETEKAREIVDGYFTARKEQGGVVGSTSEDYLSIIKQKPRGENGENYFSFVGELTGLPHGKKLPILFFAGEKIGEQKVAMYATITLRFGKYLENMNLDMTGFTAIPQYVWLEIFARLKHKGIKTVDAGGSETEGLDTQKRQLGGKPQKSHWLVKQ